MNKFSSKFHENGYFGSYPYPGKDKIPLLKEHGITVFVNLTFVNEGTRDGNRLEDYREYLSKGDIYLTYPIKDRCSPINLKAFHKFITKLIKYMQTRTIYIHCRGGHGRAGLVVASILSRIQNNASEALTLTQYYHGLREEMNDKMRKLGSPQTKRQIQFVKKYYDYSKNMQHYPKSTTQ